MRKPAAEWDEDYVLSLPLEDDRLERKGTLLLDLTLPKADQDHIRDELAKQLSAFANTGGGTLVYALTNDGKVDLGGVSRIMKGRQSTKDWIETVVPTLLDPEILGVNVYEILPEKENSAIQDGKALYVVDIPDSDRAPHQSKRDLRYYVRLGGTSQPAPHRIIEDIRNRAKHPSLQLLRIEITNLWIPRDSLPRISGRMRIRIQVSLKNVGKLKATDACLHIKIQSPDVTFDNFDKSVVKPHGTGETDALFWEGLDPIYPEMEFSFWFDVLLAVALQEAVPGLRPSKWVSLELAVT